MTPKTLRAAADEDVQQRQQDTTPPRAGASAGQRFVTRGGKALENSAVPRTREPSLETQAKTKLVRFRLNPSCSSDQRILAWLASFRPYYRANAIRTVLLEHVLRSAAWHEGSGGVNDTPLPPRPETEPAGVLPVRRPEPSTTAEMKLKTLFS